MKQKTMKFALSIKLQLLFNFIINIMLKLVIYINGLLLAYKQWGYTGEQSNKITFALSYPKAVLGIMVTTGDGIPQNPVDVTLSGAIAVGYNSAGCKTYWLAYGI